MCSVQCLQLQCALSNILICGIFLTSLGCTDIWDGVQCALAWCTWCCTVHSRQRMVQVLLGTPSQSAVLFMLHQLGVLAQWQLQFGELQLLFGLSAVWGVAIIVWSFSAGWGVAVIIWPLDFVCSF